MEFGAKIGYQGPRQRILSANLPTANEAPEVLLQDLHEQQRLNRLTRVNIIPQSFISSPLGLVPKGDGRWRRIHHLSHPRGKSVNCHIPEAWEALEYTTFDDAIDVLLAQGPACCLVKKDLADAFRHIPIASSDHWLLGFQCNDQHWVDRFLPFGLRTAPYLFDLFAKGRHWMLMADLGWRPVMHYLDDFLGVLPNQEQAELFAEQFDRLCTELGLQVNLKKTIIGQVAEFLGIELNTVNMIARLSASKLSKAINAVNTALARPSITHQELKSLLGFLAFAARVVKPGRAFLRRLFDALSKTRYRPQRITSDMKADLLWWQTFLPRWNGVSLLRKLETRRQRHLWTDASGNDGIGGYYLHSEGERPSAKQAFSERFRSNLRSKHINIKEMAAVYMAMQRWLPDFAGSHLIIKSDNFAVASGIKKTSMRGQAMIYLRKIVMLAAQHDIVINSQWISTTDDWLADLLSRGRFDKLADTNPQLLVLQSPGNGHENLHTPGTAKSPCSALPPDTSGGA